MCTLSAFREKVWALTLQWDWQQADPSSAVDEWYWAQVLQYLRSFWNHPHLQTSATFFSGFGVERGSSDSHTFFCYEALDAATATFIATNWEIIMCCTNWRRHYIMGCIGCLEALASPAYTWANNPETGALLLHGAYRKQKDPANIWFALPSSHWTVSSYSSYIYLFWDKMQQLTTNCDAKAVINSETHSLLDSIFSSLLLLWDCIPRKVIPHKLLP